MRPVVESSHEILTTYELFKKNVLDTDGYNQIKTGYHFVDIPLVNVAPIRLPTSRKLRQYLTDFHKSSQFLGIENRSELDAEPCGELDVDIQIIAPGGNSEFLPEVYRELYEEGNIIMKYN